MNDQILILRDELANDPLSIGYASMTDQEAADSLNSLIIDENKESISTEEILEAMDSAELLALTGDKATRVWGILGMQAVDPFGVAASLLVDAFGPSSATITALKVLRKRQVSRANQLSVNYTGRVRAGHVEMARAL